VVTAFPGRALKPVAGSSPPRCRAGIDRQLDRRRAMHDIRTMFAGLGDLLIELTMLGRYVLTVLDEETQLLQIAARTPPDQSARLNTAYAAPG
jgi:hypothetical protein